MTLRPSEKTIIETYTLDELLALVKEKVQRNIAAEFEGLKQSMSSILGSLRGPASVIQEHELPEEKPQTPALSLAAGGKRPSQRVSLGNLLQNVLSDEPLGVDEILEKLVQNGYKSKSKDPRRILYIELSKQVEKGTVQKAERGKYRKA